MKKLTIVIIGLLICYSNDILNWGIIILTDIVLIAIGLHINKEDAEASNEGKATVAGFMLPVILFVGAGVLTIWYAIEGHAEYNYAFKFLTR